MTSETAPLSSAAALALRAGTILSLLLVALHPTVQAAPAGEILAQLVRERTLDGFVHGALIVIILGFGFGFAGFAASLGLGRPAVLAGSIAYGIGVIAMVAAAVIDSFVGPAFAAQMPVDQAGTALDILIFASAAIQYLSKLGFIGLSLGMLGCSVTLLGCRGLARTVGWVGLVAGAVPTIFILATDPSLNPHLLILILLVQAVWNFAAAALLSRGAGRPVALAPAL